jgi:hypothetical protein
MRKVFLILNIVLLSGLTCAWAFCATSGSNLVVEEHRIVSEKTNTPNHYEFRKRIPANVLAKREKWRVDHSDRVEKQLKKYGYELRRRDTNHGTFDDLYIKQFYFKRKLVLADIREVGQFSTNGNHSHYLFVFDTIDKRFMLRDGKLSTIEEPMLSQPILVKDSIMTISPKPLTSIGSPDNATSYYAFTVKKDGKKVCDVSYRSKLLDDDVRSFFSYDDDWVLEYSEHVLINGVDIGKKNGYLKVFGYGIIGNKPFYFFENKGKVYISYDGKILPYEYDKVIHYQCCEAANFNVRWNSKMVWFFALKDGFWHYVEAGVYN